MLINSYHRNFIKFRKKISSIDNIKLLVKIKWNKTNSFSKNSKDIKSNYNNHINLMWFQIKNSNNTFSRKCNKTNRFHKFQYNNSSNKFHNNNWEKIKLLFKIKWNKINSFSKNSKDIKSNYNNHINLMWIQIKNSNNTFSRKCNKSNRFTNSKIQNL